jgi:hypothetical protein
MKPTVGPIKQLKKRGRKPKNKLPEQLPIIEENLDTEKEAIIAYLPIQLNEVDTQPKEELDKIFMKADDTEQQKIK